MNINEEANSEIKKDSEDQFNSAFKEEDKNPGNEELQTSNDEYKLGWNQYSELTNGRFAMIGFFAIILIELLSHESFLKWANILN
tara:strand:+ start:61 stop:315 length:255 start_codon:yes stop_codon:yes gene_type:complete